MIKDSGIGQHPDDFPVTLVSLNRENKREKFYHGVLLLLPCSRPIGALLPDDFYKLKPAGKFIGHR